jgi:hypothetical protein
VSDGFVEGLRDAILESLRLTQTDTRLACILSSITRVLEDLTELTTTDPGLVPELVTAVNALVECSDALKRAHEFAHTRAAVTLESFMQQGEEEG